MAVPLSVLCKRAHDAGFVSRLRMNERPGAASFGARAASGLGSGREARKSL